MFKRMGIALGMLTVSFLVYLTYDTLAHNSSYKNLGQLYNECWKNTSHVLNKSYVSLPSMYISVLQQILLFTLSDVAIHISI